MTVFNMCILLYVVIQVSMDEVLQWVGEAHGLGVVAGWWTRLQHVVATAVTSVLDATRPDGNDG